MTLLPDWREFIELLNSHRVDYVIVGAWARAFHGVPRSTGDIDFFVRASEDNALRLVEVLDHFGFGSLGIAPSDFLTPGQVIQLGIDPYRIGLVTGISDVTFEEAWNERVHGEIDGVPTVFLSLRLYRRNKRAAGRPKDLADLADTPDAD
ncbi:MAG TPA: hypothetical protein VKU19_08170 [Bryobacteraceae bacterium]|nr:hypothetical protein [Bryobacteraceae bacterium]